MLILTRRVGESVLIGEDVTITVLRVKGSQVRLGVSAPRTVSVQREASSGRIKHEDLGTGENPKESPIDIAP